MFEQLPSEVWQREWCSICKPYGRGTKAVLNYLSRYVFRIAVTNTRILGLDKTHVTFKHKDRNKGIWHKCRLTGVEFLRRFLMHVLPRGFHKVRYYGLWHHSKRHLRLRARLLLRLESTPKTISLKDFVDLCRELDPADSDDPAHNDAASNDCFSPRCPHCQSDRLILLEHRERARGP